MCAGEAYESNVGLRSCDAHGPNRSGWSSPTSNLESPTSTARVGSCCLADSRAECTGRPPTNAYRRPTTRRTRAQSAPGEASQPPRRLLRVGLRGAPPRWSSGAPTDANIGEYCDFGGGRRASIRLSVGFTKKFEPAAKNWSVTVRGCGGHAPARSRAPPDRFRDSGTHEPP